jgi:hypothetical protein
LDRLVARKLPKSSVVTRIDQPSRIRIREAHRISLMDLQLPQATRREVYPRVMGAMVQALSPPLSRINPPLVTDMPHSIVLDIPGFPRDPAVNHPDRQDRHHVTATSTHQANLDLAMRRRLRVTALGRTSPKRMRGMRKPTIAKDHPRMERFGIVPILCSLCRNLGTVHLVIDTTHLRANLLMALHLLIHIGMVLPRMTAEHPLQRRGTSHHRYSDLVIANPPVLLVKRRTQDNLRMTAPRFTDRSSTVLVRRIPDEVRNLVR